ncbi:MAG: hypothetical protein LBD86_00400 [Spirochaetaceae bacterium]|jgi:hypothetical protein|nr:hypothetical protein [Spirochaetaceae bacterium]
MKTDRIQAFVKNFIRRLNETSIFAIWMVMLMLTGILLWGFTIDLRNDIMVKTVNKILDDAGEKRKVVAAISTWHIPGSVTQFGTWYTMTGQENAVIFSIIAEGIFSPCLAIINGDGRLDSLIPLTVNADRLISRINPGYLRVWIDRIEKNAAILKRALNEKDRRRENV